MRWSLGSREQIGILVIPELGYLCWGNGSKSAVLKVNRYLHKTLTLFLYPTQTCNEIETLFNKPDSGWLAERSTLNYGISNQHCSAPTSSLSGSSVTLMIFSALKYRLLLLETVLAHVDKNSIRGVHDHVCTSKAR